MKLFFLSKENVLLSKAEAEALLGRGKLIDNCLLIDTKKTTDRLSYTRFIGTVLFSATPTMLEKKIRAYDWNKLVKKTFAAVVLLQGKKSDSLGREYGSIIYDALKKPKVDLDKPDTKIIFIKTPQQWFVISVTWENTESFNPRDPKNRPENEPITMNARLARACVNLTGATKDIYDPFCGLGGLLLEAGLAGLKAIGSDIDGSMLDRCKQNMQHYKIKKYTLFKQDATAIIKKYDYIVTDLPYGRNTKTISEDLYPKFIKTLEKVLVRRAVVIFPDFFDAEKLLQKSTLKIKGRFTYYVHKSLSRNIYVLEK
jgi:tRNA (guanine10-N2)-dimethyltransferase